MPLMGMLRRPRAAPRWRAGMGTGPPMAERELGIPRIGDRVELTIEMLPDGRRRALNVRIV